MDRKKHRHDRAAYFKRQSERYERVLLLFDSKPLQKLRDIDPVSLTDAQISAVLEFLEQEGFTPFETRDDVLETDRTFWGSDSDVTQTVTDDQRRKFEDFPKARNIFALLLLPRLLEKLDAHELDRQKFSVEDFFSPVNPLRGSAEDGFKFFGWVQGASTTDDQTARTLKFVQQDELHKSYEGHPVHLLLLKHSKQLEEVESWGLHIRGPKADAFKKIGEAAKQFARAYQPTRFANHNSALIDSVFAFILSPQDPTPFIEPEVIKLRQRGVAALQLSEAVVPRLLGILISEAKVQYILNRPLAFAAMARAALEELLKYHNDKRVSDSGRELASRIADMKTDVYKKDAMKIKDFGNNAMHKPGSLDMSKIDQEMRACMKCLDALATHFLPNRRNW